MHPPFLESFMWISTIGRQPSGHIDLRGETMCSPLFFPQGTSRAHFLNQVYCIESNRFKRRHQRSISFSIFQYVLLPAKLSLRFCNTCAHTTGKRCGCLLTGGEPPVGQTFHRPTTPHRALHCVKNRDAFCCSPGILTASVDGSCVAEIRDLPYVSTGRHKHQFWILNACVWTGTMATCGQRCVCDRSSSGCVRVFLRVPIGPLPCRNSHASASLQRCFGGRISSDQQRHCCVQQHNQ